MLKQYNNILDKLKKTLGEDGNLGKFISNINTLKDMDLHAYLYRFACVKEKNPTHFITDAFNWAASTEGYAFWEKVDAKWQKHLSEANCKIGNTCYKSIW